MRVLFIADLVGDEAVHLVTDLLPRLKHFYKIDFCIANGENADHGKGITAKQVERLREFGVDCLTSGNHIWEPRKREVLEQFQNFLLRPLNYPEKNIGVGSAVFSLADGQKIAVLNLQGRSFMTAIDCPFAAAEKILPSLRQETPNIFVDFHAEATAEKLALGWFLDGRVSALIGTHTHVQTADERILPRGSAYLTDAGMTGPIDSVIGMDINKAIERFRMQTHIYYALAKGEYRLNGVVVEINKTGRAVQIRRLNLNKAEFLNASADH